MLATLLMMDSIVGMVRPVVEEANKDAPNFSRIFKEMILVTSTDKPMFRTGKWTVIKKATLELYEAEINALQEILSYTFVHALTGNNVQVPVGRSERDSRNRSSFTSGMVTFTCEGLADSACHYSELRDHCQCRRGFIRTRLR